MKISQVEALRALIFCVTTKMMATGPDAAVLRLMYSSAVPWKVLSSNVTVNVLTEGWTLANPEPEAEDQIRKFIVDVIFDAAFSAVPVVQIGLSGFDIDQRDSARLIVKAECISEYGFQAVITTWAGSRVYAVDFNWLAIGP